MNFKRFKLNKEMVIALLVIEGIFLLLSVGVESVGGVISWGLMLGYTLSVYNDMEEV